MKGWILYSRLESDLTDERDYSVKRLITAAAKKNIDLTIVTANQFELMVSPDNRKNILIDNHPTPLPDFLIPRLGSDTYYFAMAVIRQLEYQGVRVFNNAAAIEITKDKLRTHQLMSQNNLPIPKTMLLKFPVDVELVRQEIGFPLVIKNITGTQGTAIHLCESETGFSDMMELVYSNNPTANIILQEFVAPSRGRDLRVFVLGDKVIASMLRHSDTSFKANFSRGAKVASFKTDAEIEYLALRTAKLLGLEIAGIDILFDHQGYKICEANSAPGFKGLEQVTGPVIAEQILDYAASFWK